MRTRHASAIVLATLALNLSLAPGTAHAAISFVAASSAATSGSGATSLAINKPTGVASGHVMVTTVTATGTGA
ncbi:MAG TPA: hypothetical protein VGP44_11530, partial [Gemmatimonadales bacterium]|nr:hypothetical protein [Gemmatimonadales bacterium]